MAMALVAVRAQAAEHTPFAKAFTFVGDYPLGAAVSRTDYESIDAGARRLYISKMGGGQLLVFDLTKNRLAATLDDFPKATGTLAVPSLHKIYVSVPGGGLLRSISVGLGMAGLTSGKGQIAVLDSRTLKEHVRLPGGVFPDGIAYDGKDELVFVSDELGSALTVLDAKTDKFLARVETGGEVGNVRYNEGNGLIYVPVQSRDELIAVNPATRAVMARYPLKGCDHPHGFIIAPDDAVGYAACDGNNRLLAIDLQSGRVLRALPVAADPDVMFLDPALGRLYVAAETGNLSTFDIASTAEPVSLGDVFVAEGAHTLAVDPVSHRLYFALANLGGKAVLRVLTPRRD
ncbi:MAG: YncE family protein [Rhizomicrobium sp.]